MPSKSCTHGTIIPPPPTPKIPEKIPETTPINIRHIAFKKLTLKSTFLNGIQTWLEHITSNTKSVKHQGNIF